MIRLTESYSFSMRDMTKSDASDFDGCWKLPSGAGKLISSSEYGIDIAITGYEDDNISVMVMTDDHCYSATIGDWSAPDEHRAMSLTKSIIKSLERDHMSLEEIAEKYDLTDYY